MYVLVLNCGSSSAKLAVVDPDGAERSFEAEATGLGAALPGCLSWQARGDRGEATLAGSTHGDALRALVALLRERHAMLPEFAAVGHRVVHGGESFTASLRIDAAVMRGIEAGSSLAPLHNPANLLGIRALQATFPAIPHVAVFDTAFHQTLPPRAYLYAIPRSLHRRHGVRRYGFHGTSHRFVAREAVRRLGLSQEASALVTAHLGNGCSAAAVLGGRSVDTTMGLSPLEGLVMGTRSGDVDPGLHELLARRLGLDVTGVTALLNRESGLLGVSELSNDMRELERAAADGHEGAQLAVEIFCYRLAKYVAALVVALGRLDALVFTGGIGENSPGVRARTIALLGHLGLELDSLRNDAQGADSSGVVSADGPPVALVIATDEERLIAAETVAVLGLDRGPV